MLAESSNDLNQLLMKVKKKGKKRCQSRTAFKHEEDKKIMITEEIHNFNIDTKTLKLLKVSLAWFHLSIQVETAAKKSREV